jgi:phage baseplate assembly protein W
MGTLQKIYSDLDMMFTRQPVTNDVAMSYDDQAVIRSVKQLLLTEYYERPFQPLVGTNLSGILFENVDDLNSSVISDEIALAIENFEPRAIVDSIDVTAYPDQNSFFVKLTIYIGNNTTPTDVTLILERTR